MYKLWITLLLLLLLSVHSLAITAKEIARKSYNVNHSFSVKNMIIKKNKRSSIITISRMPGKKPRVTAVERFLSNEYNDGTVEAKDLIIIRSGKLKGLGILMTSYIDPSRSHEYLMWIPALRKVRRMAEPKDAGLGAGDIAFLEDAKLRRFNEEKYILLETKKMDLDLLMMPYKKGEFGHYGKNIPYKKITKIKNRTIHILKSIYTNKNHWYDYRISYIDSIYYTDYKTIYYKNNKILKKVYRHWIDLDNQLNAKSKMWYYWYSTDISTGYEMLTYIPKKLLKINQKVKKSFWSTKTLEKIKR